MTCTYVSTGFSPGSSTCDSCVNILQYADSAGGVAVASADNADVSHLQESQEETADSARFGAVARVVVPCGLSSLHLQPTWKGGCGREDGRGRSCDLLYRCMIALCL